MDNEIVIRIKGIQADQRVVKGLLLSTLTAIMKAMKQNSSRPIDFLLRERLKERSDRRLLNVLLNQCANQVAREEVHPQTPPPSRKGRGRPVPSTHDDELHENTVKCPPDSIKQSIIGEITESVSSGESRIARLFRAHLR
jgi:hypothetical protein